MSDPILEFSDLTKVYNAGKPNEITVLNGASGAFHSGEVTALVAPSGAGKSTLLHIVGLLDSPTTGMLKIAGKDVSKAKDRERTLLRRTDLGFVYQFHHLLPEFSAVENIMLPQRAAGRRESVARDRGMELLDLVGLSGRANHRPGELSGGEQQRVAFCRALANEPKLLLADEPTGNLDPDTSDQGFDVLMNLVRSTGLCALIATHNLDMAGRMDRKVKLEKGVLQ